MKISEISNLVTDNGNSSNTYQSYKSSMLNHNNLRYYINTDLIKNNYMKCFFRTTIMKYN